MRWAALAAVFLFVALPAGVNADGEVTSSTDIARIGEPFTVELRLTVPAGATVDVDPGAASWGDVAVLGVLRHDVTAGPGGSLHVLVVEVAAFAPGEVAFRPAVVVATGTNLEVHELPPVMVRVPSVLRPGEPLELRPLPEPADIGGTPWWVQPLVYAASAAVLSAVAVAGWRLATTLRRRQPAPPPPAPAPLPSFSELAAAVESDPATGYQRLAAAVRAVLAERYLLPATALTASELRRRLEERVGDRWIARLVAGLLEECDAVVYGGYRPAPERRQADLAMAAAILQGGE